MTEEDEYIKTCPDCGREFYLKEISDFAEWHYGHHDLDELEDD